MRNAWMLMPIAAKNGVPIRENVNRISAEIDTALIAILRWYSGVAPAVRLTNTGATDSGSTTTKNTMKNLMT